MSQVGIHVTLGEVAASLVLVALAVAVSVWRRTDLEKDIAIAVVRSAIQLIAIGYVIQAIFDEDSLWLVFALIAVMVVFGAFTAKQRARRVPGAFWPLLIALAVSVTRAGIRRGAEAGDKRSTLARLLGSLRRSDHVN